MKVQNHPGAYGVLAGLIVLLLGVYANAGCAHPKPVVVEQVEPTRTPMQRDESAVKIMTPCGYGSGVLIDGKHVLTAFHVINCAELPLIAPAPVVLVQTEDGQAHLVASTVFEPLKDIARLDLADEIPNVTPVKIRKAKVGEIVCANVVVPERGVRCGTVDELAKDRMFGDVKMKFSSYWFGNSGGGAYGEDGALVGLVVRLAWCTAADAFLWELGVKPDRTCGGRITSITDTSVLP